MVKASKFFYFFSVMDLVAMDMGSQESCKKLDSRSEIDMIKNVDIFLVLD